MWLIPGSAAGQGMVFDCPKQGVFFVICPKQGPKMKDVVLNRVDILGYFRPFFGPKQGQGFKPLAAPLYPNMGQVPPPPHSPG